ncbi:MAG: VOC family protein [Thermodesulfobacteriota bacterium]
MHTFCHIEIPADDLKSLQQFYSELFGWNLQKVPGEMDYYIEEQKPEAFGIGMMQRQAPEHGMVPYVLVEDVARSLEKAVALGATVIMPRTAVPAMGWFAVFMDPQKNAMGIWQTDDKAA